MEQRKRDLKTFSAISLTGFLTGTQALPWLFKHTTCHNILQHKRSKSITAASQVGVNRLWDTSRCSDMITMITSYNFFFCIGLL